MSDEKIGGLVDKIEEYELRCRENLQNKNLAGSISELYKKLETLKKLKSIFQKRNDDKMANRLLVDELTIEGDISFLGFSIAFVRSKFGKAWDELHSSLNNYGFANEVANQIGIKSKEGSAKFAKCLEIIDAFPQQWFMSLEILIKKSECSICGKDIRECNHIKGKAYGGELCVAIVKDMEPYKGISLTNNPLDPRCRVVPLNVDYEKGWFVGSGFSKETIKGIMKQQKKVLDIIARKLGTFKERF